MLNLAHLFASSDFTCLPDTLAAWREADAGRVNMEIGRLAFGHTWKGQTKPPGEPAILQIGSDGKTGFRTPTRIVLETVTLEGDTLCEQSEFARELPICGPVFGPEPGMAAPDYVLGREPKASARHLRTRLRRFSCLTGKIQGIFILFAVTWPKSA